MARVLTYRRATTTIDYPTDADVTFAYTATGQRSTATRGHGTTTHAHDARDRLVRRTDSAGRVIEYSYDAAGNLTSRVTASQTPDYRYDRRSRLRELTQRSAAAVLLFSATYATDAAGLRTGITEADEAGTTRTVAYDYDQTRRLTREIIDHRDATRDRTTAWTYDRVGNRLTQVTTTGTGATQATTTVASTYDANDRLTREDERTGSAAPRITATTYDANGNTTRKESPDGVTEYTWDDANRLKEQRTASGRTEYRYDADGLRIGQTTYPTTGTPKRTDYVVDPTYAYANVIERWEGEGATAGTTKLAAVHVFGEGVIGQVTCEPTASSAPTDCPTASERILHADGFGSTRYLTNPTGTITDRIDYDAFGNEIAREGDTDVEHLYRGEQYDASLGYYYLRARYMDPARGRFASMDPFAGFVSDPMSVHKYQYAHASPINGIDPSGYTTLADTSMAQALSATLISSAIAVGGGAAAMVAKDSVSRRTADRAATQACVASLVGTTVTGPVCGNTSIPILFVTPTRTPEIAEHILRSQASGRPRLLSRTALQPVMSGNRSFAYLHCSMGTNRVAPDSGSSCDEYPYASTYEGGLYASVRKVPLWEQFVQGGELSAFYTLCGVPGDVPVLNEFVVAPVAHAPRLFQCGVFR